LLGAGIDGLCIGGATGEYPRLDLRERKELVRQSFRLVAGRIPLIAAVGGADYRSTLELGRFAADAGAVALLVPPPFFFGYTQEDVEHFFREAVRRLPLPCLIYNLPSFTSAVAPSTSFRLLTAPGGPAGIKDSSGDARVLAGFARLKEDHELSLMVGNDSLVLQALDCGWDGTITGLGNVCPELMVLLYAAVRSRRSALAKRCQAEWDRIIEWVKRLPFPWTIRCAMEVRGISCGPHALPPAPGRRQTMREFCRWYEAWLDGTRAWVASESDASAWCDTATGSGRSASGS
jgi:4-hydroxy-tetrahydrodipicolinate synthase